MKSFHGCRTTQLEHQTIPILEEQQHDASGIHVGINNLLENNVATKSNYEICSDQNIATIFISSIVYSIQVNSQLIHNINALLCNACVKYEFKFVDKCAVSKSDKYLLIKRYLLIGKLQDYFIKSRSESTDKGF